MKPKKFQFPHTPAPVPENLSGLQRMCRNEGGMRATQDGKTVEYRWDYFQEKAILASEMTGDTKRYSDRARLLKAEGML